MSTVNQGELKAIKVLKFTGKESEWDHWSEEFVALARARGLAYEEIDRKKTDGSYELTDEERKEKTQAGKQQCIHKFAIVM